MSTLYRDCKQCGVEIGSAHEGFEEGIHPECRPFTKAKVLSLNWNHLYGTFDQYPIQSPFELEEAIVLGDREVLVFDTRKPVPFTKDSFPEGGMPSHG